MILTGLYKWYLYQSFFSPLGRRSNGIMAHCLLLGAEGPVESWPIVYSLGLKVQWNHGPLFTPLG